jgi:arsenite-transporting ATPase
LISTDPAHTLSDAFGIKIGNVETKINENLDAIQIDPVYEAIQNYSALFEFISEIFKTKGIDETIAYEIANFPGSTGAAALLKLVLYVEKNLYDTIILDMIPSGDALKLLYFPYIIGRLSRRVMGIFAPVADVGRAFASVLGINVPSKEVIKTELKLLNLLEKAQKILTDHEQTSLRLIVNPDSFSIENAKRTYIQASIYNINTDMLIINKIMPKDIKAEYFEEWIKLQDNYIKKCEIEFSNLHIKKVSLFKSEVKGIDNLKNLANEIFGEENPLKIYSRFTGININQTEKGIEITVPAPFVKKENLEIERVSDELIIHVETDIGKSSILLPLPFIAYKYSLKSAKLINDKIHIYFE